MIGNNSNSPTLSEDPLGKNGKAFLLTDCLTTFYKLCGYYLAIFYKHSFIFSLEIFGKCLNIFANFVFIFIEEKDSQIKNSNYLPSN